MNIKKRFCASSLIMTFLIILLAFLAFLEATSVQCADEYTYYGVVPSRIWYARPKKSMPGAAELDVSSGFEIDPLSVAKFALISIVATKDNTDVKVYTLNDGKLVSSVELNTMQKHFVTLPNGTIFKIVSNNVVSVMLVGGNIGGADLDPNKGVGPGAATFVTSVDGIYVGKQLYSQDLKVYPDHPIKSFP